jgi:hypothetical protein
MQQNKSHFLIMHLLIDGNQGPIGNFLTLYTFLKNSIIYKNTDYELMFF